MRFPPARLITPVGNGPLARTAGFRDTAIIELGWRETHELKEGIHIRITPSRHWSNRVRGLRNRRLWEGFFIQSGGRTAHFVGETGINESLFKDIRRQCEPCSHPDSRRSRRTPLVSGTAALQPGGGDQDSRGSWLTAERRHARGSLSAHERRPFRAAGCPPAGPRRGGNCTRWLPRHRAERSRYILIGSFRELCVNPPRGMEPSQYGRFTFRLHYRRNPT